MQREESAEAIVAVIRQVLEERPGILLAVLYGSAATGRLTPDSDIDLAVAGDTALSLDARLELMAALSLALDRETEVVDLNAVDGALLCEALPGKLVRSKAPELYAALIRRMWYYREDMLPLLQRSIDARLRRREP